MKSHEAVTLRLWYIWHENFGEQVDTMIFDEQFFGRIPTIVQLFEHHDNTIVCIVCLEHCSSSLSCRAVYQAISCHTFRYLDVTTDESTSGFISLALIKFFGESRCFTRLCRLLTNHSAEHIETFLGNQKSY